MVAPYLRGYPPSGLAPDGSYGIGPLARDAVELHAVLGGAQRAVLIGSEPASKRFRTRFETASKAHPHG